MTPVTKEQRLQEMFDAFTHDLVSVTEYFPHEWKIELRNMLIRWLRKEYPDNG